MHLRGAIAGFVLLTLFTSVMAVACASFGGNGDATPNDAATSDGAAPGQTSDAGGGSTDAEIFFDAELDAALDASGAPFVRSFSKAFVSTSNMDGGISIARPATAQIGDLLVLVTFTFGNDTPASSPVIPATDEVVFCASQDNRLQFGSIIDDGSASYSFSWIDSEISTLDALLLDIPNGSSSPDDFQVANDNSSMVSAAPPVSVFHTTDLVLVGFAFDNSNYSPSMFGAPEGGLEVLTTTNAMVVYDGYFPMGTTPSFGPFSTAPPCWGSFSVAIPPQ